MKEVKRIHALIHPSLVSSHSAFDGRALRRRLHHKLFQVVKFNLRWWCSLLPTKDSLLWTTEDRRRKGRHSRLPEDVVHTCHECCFHNTKCGGHVYHRKTGLKDPMPEIDQTVTHLGFKWLFEVNPLSCAPQRARFSFFFTNLLILGRGQAFWLEVAT